MQGSKRDTDIKNRLLDYVGEGKGGMIWEKSIETCIIIYEIDHQSKFDAWNTQSQFFGTTQKPLITDEGIEAETLISVSKITQLGNIRAG